MNGIPILSDRHGLACYLRCLAVLLILITQRGPVRPTIMTNYSLKYWWSGDILILGS